MIKQIKNYGKHLPEAILANIKSGFVGRKIKVIGVTGTDGKTTTVNMIYQILKKAGKKVSMVSTINAVVGGKVYDTGFHVTSPKASIIQKFLKKAYNFGDEWVVLEVTSHALEQFRVWGIKFEIGLITNVTHEHIDYHGSFENYLNTKAKLIKNSKIVILNADDPNFSKLEKMVSGKILSFGIDKKADLTLKNFPLKLKIPGQYNLANALAASLVGQTIGIEDKVIRKSLENFSTLSGRMEEIKNNKGIKIFVDFAHTPNALQQALTTLRIQTKGKLIAVFGAASERDREKRPMMGEISGKLADITVLTDEDPRFESSSKIIEEIATGCYQAGSLDGKNLFKEPDRTEAIKLAINLVKNGDVIGIFGKGHEKSMNYQGRELPWSDQETVRKLLSNGSKN